MWSIDKETPFTGVLKILGDDLLQLGLQCGNVVGFTPRSEYEFVIENERMYRVRSVNINIDYGYKETKKSIIQAGRKAIKELIKVAEEPIITNTEDDVSADRLKNAAATKKLAIFDAFEILNRIQEEENYSREKH